MPKEYRQGRVETYQSKYPRKLSASSSSLPAALRLLTSVPVVGVGSVAVTTPLGNKFGNGVSASRPCSTFSNGLSGGCLCVRCLMLSVEGYRL